MPRSINFRKLLLDFWPWVHNYVENSLFMEGTTSPEEVSLSKVDELYWNDHGESDL